VALYVVGVAISLTTLIIFFWKTRKYVTLKKKKKNQSWLNS